MRKYLQESWTSIYLAPDGSSVAGGTSPGHQQGGAKQESSGASSETDPFAGIDLDDLDPDARKLIEGGKQQFASLQKQLAESAKAAEIAKAEAKKFQSGFDQLQAQVQKLTGGPNGAQSQLSEAEQAKAHLIDKFTKTLLAKNVAPDLAKSQAELMADMMGEFGAQLKTEIGKDLSPFAATVVSREAELSWHQAVTADQTGVFQDQAIAKEVWDQVQMLVAQGQQVTPQTVQNLAGMVYYQLAQSGKLPQQQQQQQPPPTMTMPPTIGRLSVPGGFGSPQRQMPPDPSAARTVLDPATVAALKTVVGKWGDAGKKTPLMKGN